MAGGAYEGVREHDKGPTCLREAAPAKAGNVAGRLFQHPAKDNFILVASEGKARRMNVGDPEGHRMPFVVQTIVEECGTPWHVEFWHWITG